MKRLSNQPTNQPTNAACMDEFGVSYCTDVNQPQKIVFVSALITTFPPQCLDSACQMEMPSREAVFWEIELRAFRCRLGGTFRVLRTGKNTKEGFGPWSGHWARRGMGLK